MKPYILLSLFILFLFIPTPLRAQNAVTFDDQAADRLVIRNDHYILTLKKSNGGVMALVDRATDHNLTLGSRYDCLWGSVFPGHTPEYVGGCSYEPGQFSYAWDGTLNTLTLRYRMNPATTTRLNAEVLLHFGTGHTFDMEITLENHWGATLKSVLLPSDWLFADDAVVRAYAPFMLPGVQLEQGFFRHALRPDHNFTPIYPDGGAFADLLALEMAEGGRLAFYTINPTPNPVQPVTLGFVDSSQPIANSWHTYHAFTTWVTNGQSWHSPLVRVWVGAEADVVIRAYRTDNQIDSYPSAEKKAGARWESLKAAPLIKMHLFRPFNEFTAELDRLPSPALIHPVAFQADDHDKRYPDFLPPDPRWGTIADFRRLVETAHANNQLVMPYTNPTWWNPDSPTLSQLPVTVTLTDIVAINGDGGLQVEEYGNGTRPGYVMSPYAPFVQQRLAALMQQWQREVPVDCIFEDQIGARNWRIDLNRSSPTPLSYSDGWLRHLERYADRCLMTEIGWDRLAQHEVGFHGSLLSWQRLFDFGDGNFGAGNWRPYPISLWMLHDKVLHYQHDLAGESMTSDKSTLTWNMSFGMMLSYEWQIAQVAPLENDWLDVVRLFQQQVASRYAGQPLTSYRLINDSITETRFGDLTIRTNWSPYATHLVDTQRIAPSGFYAHTDDGSLQAGIFLHFFNDVALSAGEHYIILTRTHQAVEIYHPIGPDSATLSFEAPLAWQTGMSLTLQAINQQGQVIADHLPFSRQNRRIYLPYHATLNGQEVDHYTLMTEVESNAANPPLALYLPMATYR